jgi:hypothetical protein
VFRHGERRLAAPLALSVRRSAGTVGAMAWSVGMTTVTRPARRPNHCVSTLPRTIWLRYMTSLRTKLHAGLRTPRSRHQPMEPTNRGSLTSPDW